MFGEYLDAARLTLTCQTCSELWTASVPFLAPIAPALLVGLLVVSALLFSKHSAIAVATPFASIGQWVKNWTVFTALSRRKQERVMRKERSEERQSELEDDILDFIESKRTSEVWSDLECDIEYVRLSRRFPIFNYAVDNPIGAREAIAKERARVKENATKGGARQQTVCIVRTKSV